jgi:uncharacterized protein YecE (DUF72 family)
MDISNKIHIGTSGWSYKHWKGIYYPAGLKPADYLSYYSRDFHTSEINSSFYRLPSQTTIRSWLTQVPPTFIFCPKMSRFLSHMKKLHDAEEPLNRFFSIFSEMKAQLGPVLIQLPVNVHFHPEITEHFYQVLQKQPDYRFGMEVRHDSWFCDESIHLLRQYKISLVIAHSQELPYLETITARDIYIRFHGPKGLYSSPYSNSFLADYVEKFRKWESEGNTIWAYFNNDINGYALTNAKTMSRMIQD